MPVDPNIPLSIGNPVGIPLAQDMQAIYAAQNQQYKNYAQQQDIAGQNALRSVLSDPNNINPISGLPNAAALAPVAGVDPQRYLDLLLATEKFQEHQQRSNTANFNLIQKYNTLVDEKVAGPALEYNQQLLQQNLPPDQRLELYNKRKRELAEDLRKSYGVPDQIINVINSPEPPEVTAFRSASFKKQQENIGKGWSNPQVDDTGNTFFYNKFAGGAYLNRNLGTPYQVQGNVRKAASEKEPEALKDVTKDSTVYGITKNPATGLLMKDGVPYTPVGNIQKLDARVTGNVSGLQPDQMVRVRKPDGSTEMVPANATKRQAGEPAQYYDLKGNLIDPSTIIETKVPASVADRPKYSDQAVDVLADQAMTGDPAALRSTWGGAELRAQVINKLSEKAVAQWGKEDAGRNLALINAMFTSQEHALTGLTKLRANVGNFEGTALREANLALDLAPKGLAGGTPVLNRWIQAGRKGLAGDADVTNLNTAVVSFTNEYARIMSSPGATGGVTSDTARAEAAGLLNAAMNPEQFSGAIDKMKTSMANRVKAIQEQIQITLKDIGSGGGTTAPLTPMPANPPSEPSPTGVPRGTSAPLPPKSNFDTLDAAKAAIKPSIKPYTLDNHGTIEYWKLFPDGSLKQTDINGKPL